MTFQTVSLDLNLLDRGQRHFAFFLCWAVLVVENGSLFIELRLHGCGGPVQKFDFIHSFWEVEDARFDFLDLDHAYAAVMDGVAVAGDRGLPLAGWKVAILYKLFARKSRYLQILWFYGILVDVWSKFNSVLIFTFRFDIPEAIIRICNLAAWFWADLRVALAQVVPGGQLLDLRGYVSRFGDFLFGLFFDVRGFEHSRIPFIIRQKGILKVTERVLARLDLLCLGVDKRVGATAVCEVRLIQPQTRRLRDRLRRQRLPLPGAGVLADLDAFWI